MRQQLRSTEIQDLQLLVIDPLAFEKAKVEADEISLNGKMYDIAKTEMVDGMVWVYCKQDLLEENLLALVAELVSKPVDQNHFPGVISQYLNLAYIVPEANFFLYPNEETSRGYSTYVFSSIESILCKHVPPPRVTPDRLI